MEKLKHLNISSEKQIPWQKKYLLPLIKYSLKIFLLFFVAAAASRAEHEPFPKTERWSNGRIKLNWHSDRKDW